MTFRSRSYMLAVALAGLLTMALIPAARAQADCNTPSDCFAAAGLQDAASEQYYNGGVLYQVAARGAFARGDGPAAALYDAASRESFNKAAFIAAASDNNYRRGEFIATAQGTDAVLGFCKLPVGCKPKHPPHAPKCVHLTEALKGRYGAGYAIFRNDCGVPYRNPQRVRVVITGFPDSSCMSVSKGHYGHYAFWGLYHGLHSC